MDFTNQALKFHSDAVGDNTLLLTKLSGTEQLSGLFRFHLELVSTDPNLDLEAILYKPAKVGIQHVLGPGMKTFKWFNGSLSEFRELEQGQSWTRYRAVLVPDLWKLSEFYRSRVYQGLDIKELVTKVLEQPGTELKDGTDFEFKLDRDQGLPPPPDDDPSLKLIYPKHSYVVQYEETDYDFVARWLEHEGIFFWFENDGTAEKVVFADSVSHYKPVNPGASSYPYRPQGRSQSSSDDGDVQPEEILSLTCLLTRQPKHVSLNDYNWRDPAQLLATKHEVHDQGVGLQTEYNDHYKTPDQGKELGKIRAEEWTCRAKIFEGNSTCRSFRPGRTFEINDHFRDDFNASYLLVAVQHEAEQSINLEASSVTGANYSNSFQAIPADLAFRPERLTDWPSIKGTIHAKIDTADEDDEYAHLNEMGQYKVRLPFDEHAIGDEAAEPGEASRWVRMAQPFAGRDAGMTFPLRPGTEVLLTHIDGDPDRPIIAGAVNNREDTSPIDESNRTRNRLRSVGGTTITMDDDQDQPGFVQFDQTRSIVIDSRFRHGSQSSEDGSGGGGGGGRRPKRRKAPSVFGPRKGASPLAKGQASSESLPGPGLGSTKTGSESADYQDIDHDPTDGGPIEDAFTEFTSGDAVQTLASESRYISVGDPIPLDSGTLDDDKIRATLDKLLAKHPTVTSASQALDEVLTFSGSASGSSLGVKIGDAITVTTGDKYTFADVGNDVSFGTGGWGFHQEDGDTDDESIHNGDSNSVSTHTGNSTSNSTHNGDDDSTSTHIGNSVSNSTSMGTSDSTSMSLGASTSASISMGASTSTSMDMQATNSTSMSTGADTSTSLSMGAQTSTSMDMAACTSMSLNLGASNETKIYCSAAVSNVIGVGAESSIKISAGASAGIDISAAAKAEIAISAAATAKLDIAAAAAIEIAIKAAADLKLDINAAAAIEMKIAASAIVEITIAAAAKVEIEIAAAETKIEIPGETKVSLQDQVTALQHQNACLSENLLAVIAKVGV